MITCGRVVRYLCEGLHVAQKSRVKEHAKLASHRVMEPTCPQVPPAIGSVIYLLHRILRLVLTREGFSNNTVTEFTTIIIGRSGGVL